MLGVEGPLWGKHGTPGRGCYADVSSCLLQCWQKQAWSPEVETPLQMEIALTNVNALFLRVTSRYFELLAPLLCLKMNWPDVISIPERPIWSGRRLTL